MDNFDEHSEKAQQIVSHVECLLRLMESYYGFTLKYPRHKVARWTLGSIKEFTPENGGD